MDCTPAATCSAASFCLTPLAFALVLAMGFAGPAQAAVFTVTNLNDAGLGSLREAVINANSTPGADTIAFAPGLTGTITLVGGELSVTDSLVVNGPSATALTLSGNNASRIFNSSAGSLTVSGLTITAGRAAGYGGALLVAGDLSIDQSTITQSTATAGGGAIADTRGGGNNLTLTNSVISGNSAGGSGGGIYLYDMGRGTLANTVISGNTAGAAGGGIYLYGNTATFEFNEVTISGNTAGTVGGGFALGDDDAPAGQPAFVFTGSTISGNIAATRGGGIDAPASALDSFAVIDNSTLSGNTVTNGSGAALILTPNTAGSIVRNSTIAGNTATAGPGGAVVLNGGQDLSIVSTIVANNTDSSGNVDVVRTGGTLNANNSLLRNISGGAINGTGFANITGVDPLLGPLQSNGGPTQTRQLQAGSPALETGSNPTGRTTDQRGAGFPRTRGAATDIGAVEGLAPPPPPPAPVSPTSIPTLSEWAIALLAAMLALVAKAVGFRRQR